MKRRTFLAAVAPIFAAVAPATAQAPLGTTATGDPARPIGGRLRPANPGPLTGATEPSGAPAAAPAAGSETKKAKGPTEITSREAMLDNRINLATFNGEVEVKDPEYYLTCDKLTVHLKKQKGKAGDAKPAAGGPKPIGAAEDEPAPKAAPAEKGGGDGGIEKAIAEGNVTITQEKLDGNGKKQRYYGKARRAVFDPDKKTCVLYGWPRISQTVEEKDTREGREIVATQENTVMTLDQAGIINVAGPNRVILNGLNSFDSTPGGSR
jgi:lipopolysaccharide export system protein LptA